MQLLEVQFTDDGTGYHIEMCDGERSTYTECESVKVQSLHIQYLNQQSITVWTEPSIYKCTCRHNHPIQTIGHSND